MSPRSRAGQGLEGQVVSGDPRVLATQQARRARAAWGDLPGAQKTIAVVVLVALVAGGAAFLQWQSTPSYGPLYTGLSGADGGAVVEQLQSAGVPYRIADGGGTILVPSEQVYEQRLQMSAAGLPSGDSAGYSLLDEQGVTASQFQQKVAFQRAMEGELAKTVQAIDGVDAAVVHLAIPEKDVFLEADDAPTASVLVETAAGRTLEKGQVQAVVNLVSSSVEGMTPEAVTVVDGEGTLLTAAPGGSGSAGGADAADLTVEYEQRVAASLQQLLDTVVGPGKAVATVTADLDADSRDTTTERFIAEDGVPPLSETTETETYTGGNGGSIEAGVLGPDNIVVPNGTVAGQAGTESSYEKGSNTVNNAVGKVTEKVQSAPGAVQKLNVSVVVDRDAVARTDMLALQNTVSAAVGLDPARGDQIAVTQLPFDTSSAEAVAAELEAAKEAEAAAGTQQTIWTAALGGLVLLVVILSLILGARRRRRTEPVDLGLYAPVEDDLDAEAAALPPVPAPREALPAAPDPEQEQLDALSRQREEVIELVDREPEEVAELLRSWLADRRTS
ncbi:flagellar basal-body MS-ring/collar protein FliF [Aquipuribacter sp. SD81]|uniref:flagellar basal-body MS-ring/collar protein FliF n=1 Tax=Aquipuribacter sp. SD81 TaxID=3127703 RepID=UPI003015F9C3